MIFGEDACRIHKDNAPLAIATIHPIALNFLQITKQGRESIRRLRKKAGWDNDTLLGVSSSDHEDTPKSSAGHLYIATYARSMILASYAA